MTFKFTKEHLAHMIKHKNNDAAKVSMWFDAMEDIFPKYKIDTPYRIAGFIAQSAHESAKFTKLEENLNYSEASLKKHFARYFSPTEGKPDAKDFARKPKKIAEHIYWDKNRKNKLGNKVAADGWTFRGRGLKQLTGRDNYTAFGKSLNPEKTAEQAVAYVATEEGAIESACWFWNKNRLNDAADICDMKRMTKIINGGEIGLAARKKLYDAALETLGYKARAGNYRYKTLGTGRTNPKDNVKAMQKALGITDDGSFGSGTRDKVKAFQEKHHLTKDGIAGPQTLTAIYALAANKTPPIKLPTQPAAKAPGEKNSPAGIVGATNVTLQYITPILFSTEVRIMQKALKINPADGLFGNGTRTKVIAFQKLHKDLENDGKAGPMTLKKLYNV